MTFSLSASSCSCQDGGHICRWGSSNMTPMTPPSSWQFVRHDMYGTLNADIGSERAILLPKVTSLCQSLLSIYSVVFVINSCLDAYHIPCMWLCLWVPLSGDVIGSKRWHNYQLATMSHRSHPRMTSQFKILVVHLSILWSENNQCCLQAAAATSDVPARLFLA